MALLLDSFGESEVLEQYATRLRNAVEELEGNLSGLDADSQTKLLSQLTERILADIAKLNQEVVQLSNAER